MLYSNYTEDLLGLKGAVLIKIKKIENTKHIYLETKAEAMVCLIATLKQGNPRHIGSKS